MQSNGTTQALANALLPLAEEIRLQLLGEVFASFEQTLDTIAPRITPAESPLSQIADLLLGDLPAPFSKASIGDTALSLFDDLGETGSFSDNVISNNAAILLTDEAESKVDFLYINPIEFFNGGRSSDITVNISTAPGTGSAQTAAPEGAAAPSGTGPEPAPISPSDPATLQPELTVVDRQETQAEMTQTGSITVEDNVIGNNAAILATDNAVSTVNFLYVNPIEFFNTGRGSDIHLDISLTGDTHVSESGSQTDASEEDVTVLESPSNEQGAFGAEAFQFAELDAAEAVLATEDGVGRTIDNNFVGNNGAILLTDDAQSTVNFIYINPIEFFNEGRSGDIYLNVTVDQDDGLTLL